MIEGEGEEKVVDMSMREAKTLAQAQALADKIPPKPETLPLAALVKWVIENDPEFGGRDERGVFAAAFGDGWQARMTYRESKRKLDDPGVRAFCLARINNFVKSLSNPTAPI